MSERADRELVVLARSGDKEAFGQLVERYGASARRVALQIVSTEEVARDLVQEALLQAYLSLDCLRDADRFKSWLYGIVLNLSRSYIRDQEKDYLSLESLTGGLRFEVLPFASLPPDPQKVAEERELHYQVLAAVNSLSPKNRTATLLFYYKYLSMKEIASTLGITVGAVKVRLHRARRQLREQLLPLYAEVDQTVSTNARSKIMVEVTIADVIKHERTEHYIVVLLDKAGQRILPVWIGPYEAHSIAIGMQEFPTTRPLTYHFIANLLEAVDVELEEVRVESLKEEVFYAVVKLNRGDVALEVDARPSDALALAARMGSPVYVAEKVLEKAGIDVKEEHRELSPTGKGVEGILKELEEVWRKATARMSSTEEEREKSRQELLEVMFASESW